MVGFSPRAGEGFNPEEGGDLIHSFKVLLGDSPLPGCGLCTEAPSLPDRTGGTVGKE